MHPKLTIINYWRDLFCPHSTRLARIANKLRGKNGSFFGIQIKSSLIVISKFLKNNK